MVRKSKAEALITRAQLLDAAERTFLAQGVAGTSLQQVAAAAGLTRGAIYWHFQDKADLFSAMMERVILPCECAAGASDGSDDPSAALRTLALTPLQTLAEHEQVRRVFRIAMHLTEYVGELAPVAARHEQAIADYVARMMVHTAALVPAEQARAAALGLFALVDGLMRQWTLRPEAFELLSTGAQCIDTYLAGLRPQAATAAPPAAPARSPRKSPARPARST